MRFSWLLLVALLAACQPVPQPFRHNGQAPAIATPPVTAGVTVLPVSRAPEPTATALSRAMAAALRDANIAAATFGGNRASLFLQGVVEDDGTTATLLWELFDGDGDLLGSYPQPIDGTPVALWQSADPILMRSLASAGVGPVADIIRPSTTPANGGLAVTLPPITGDAPAGAPQLAAAMLAAFAAGQSTIDLIAEPAAAPLKAYGLRGHVSLDPPRGSDQTVTVTWTLTDQEGGNLGSIVQSNTLSAGVLAGDWRSIADPIAAAAVPGILDLVDRLGLQKPAPTGS